jgi:hypothetical protein
MRKLIAFACVAVAFTGCATITRGTTTGFAITTEPTGANVSLSNGLSCTTPCALKVKRRPGFTVSISKEGYKEVSTNVISQISGGGGTAMAGNILLGGIIGAGVDGSTGAMNDLNPNPLHIIMEEE